VIAGGRILHEHRIGARGGDRAAPEIGDSRERTREINIPGRIDRDVFDVLRVRIAKPFAPDMQTERREFGHESIVASGRRQRPAAEIDRTGHESDDDGITCRIESHGRAFVTAASAECAAQQMYAGGAQRENENIVGASNAGKGTSAEIHRCLKYARDQNVAGSIDGNAKGTIDPIGAELFAPDVIALRVVFGNENIRIAIRCREGSAAKIDDAREATDDHHITARIDGDVINIVVERAADALGPGGIAIFIGQAVAIFISWQRAIFRLRKDFTHASTISGTLSIACLLTGFAFADVLRTHRAAVTWRYAIGHADAHRAAFIDHAVAIFVSRQGAGFHLGNDFANARTISGALAIAGLNARFAISDVLRAHGARVTSGRRIRHAKAPRAAFIDLSVAVLIPGERTAFCLRYDFADAGAVGSALAIAGLNARLAIPDVQRIHRSVVTGRGRIGRATAILVDRAVAIVIAHRRARFGARRDFAHTCPISPIREARFDARLANTHDFSSGRSRITKIFGSRDAESITTRSAHAPRQTSAAASHSASGASHSPHAAHCAAAAAAHSTAAAATAAHFAGRRRCSGAGRGL